VAVDSSTLTPRTMFDDFPALSLLLLVPAIAAGCKRSIPPPDNPLESPEALRGAVQSRMEDLRDARFKEVVLEYFGDDRRIKVRQLILVERPDKIRVQTRVPGTNEIASLLVTDGDTFALHRREDNRYVTGPPTPANIDRLLPVDLSPPDIVRVMLGGAPWERFDAQPGTPTLEWDRRRGRYAYRVSTEEGGRLVMNVRPTDYGVTAVRQIDADGKTVYEYTTDDWERTGSVALPTRRRFVATDPNVDFSVDVGETELNVGFPARLFELSPPPGSDVVRVNAAGQTIPADPSGATD
ncbi:MAG: outer membrane lipoprotein carrier protein LolA, partial [Bradymonadaceae bacterium]